jgi:hypothetical protein
MHRTSIARGLALSLVALLLPLSAAATSGNLSVLTYNVAGLPLGLSSGNPEVNTVLISPLLNGFDLALVQEDFDWHEELVTEVEHPYQSIKDTTDSPFLPPQVADFLELGDGLNRFSDSPFSEFQRITWDMCFGLATNGADCFAVKGFSVGRHEIAPGAFVDVYNWHAEAGGDEEDNLARRDNLRQLYTFIETFSAGRAVIVMGDSNSRYTDAEDIMPELLAATGLTDVWVELVRAGDVPDIGPRLDQCLENDQSGADCEQIDKILYRSGGGVELSATAYQVENALFQDAAGLPLSDHFPVAAEFHFSVPEPSTCLLLLSVAVACRRRSPRRPTPGR